MINELTDSDAAPIGDRIRGTTFESTAYPGTHDGNTYEFIDTAGLDEASGGTVSPVDAATNLIRLLHKSKEGFNLLIFVMKEGKLMANAENNYTFFVDVLTGGNIPVIVVVTGCEDFEPMSDWLDYNTK